MAPTTSQFSSPTTDSKMETTFGVGCWFCCSIGMMVFNKLAIQSFPAECSLVAMQMGFTVLVMLVGFSKAIHIGSLQDVARWSIVTPFFMGMLLSSILALKWAPMTLLIVIRAFSPIFSLLIERFYPNPLVITKEMVASIFTMVMGAAMYVHGMQETHLTGICWAVLNIFFAVGDRLLQRLMLAKDQQPVDISKTGITLLNNLEGMVPLLIVAYLKNEFVEVAPAFANLTPLGWLWLSLSCVVGVLISYTGIWAQSLISATSFLVLVNVNKFVVIFLEAFVMGAKTLTLQQILGASVTIIGGIGYGKARELVEAEATKSLKDDAPIKNDMPEEKPLLLEEKDLSNKDN